jgi:glutaredoxin
MTVELYTKSNCRQCVQTVKNLDKKGVTYESKSLENPENLEFVKSINMMSAPVVIVRDAEGNITESWGGFNPDMLNKIGN